MSVGYRAVTNKACRGRGARECNLPEVKYSEVWLVSLACQSYSDTSLYNKTY